MRVLVTGAAGFIGTHLCEQLLARGDTVSGLDNFNDFYDPRLKRAHIQPSLAHGQFTLYEGDILDPVLLERVFQEAQPDRVVHLAAWAGVRPSIDRPLLYQQVNVEGTTRLLEACRRFGVRHFVFASSSSVYGDRDHVPFRETDNVDHPVSPYAATKKAGELLCYTWHHLFGLHTHCLRFFTVYGPRQRPEMAIHKFARLMLRGEPIPVFGDGQSSRDYTYIDDIIQGVIASLDRCEGYRVYNLGEQTTTRLGELVELLSEALGCPAKMDYLPNQAGDVQRTFADIQRAQEELGYRPQVDMREGLRRFAVWLKAQPDLIK